MVSAIAVTTINNLSASLMRFTSGQESKFKRCPQHERLSNWQNL